MTEIIYTCIPNIFHLCFPTAVTEDGKVRGQLSKDFFKEEYILNNKIGIHIHVV